MNEKNENRPIADLFAELKKETTTLLQKEMELFRVEILGKIAQLVKDVAALGVGGVLLYTGFLTLVAALVLGVAEFISPWLSALLVGGLLCLVGVILLAKGQKDIAQMKITPEKTAQTLKETAKWAKTQMK